MLTPPTADLLKDVRERLRRGTVTPQDVEDLLDAVEDLSSRVGDYEGALAVVEALKRKVRRLRGDLQDARDAVEALTELAKEHGL
jgi:hypothetical protein